MNTRKGIIEAAVLYSVPNNNTIISFPAILAIETKNITNETIMEIERKNDLSSGLFSNFSYATGDQNVEKVCLRTITKATNLIAAAYNPNSLKSLHCLKAILSNDSNNQVINIVNIDDLPNRIISFCVCFVFITYKLLKLQNCFPKYTAINTMRVKVMIFEKIRTAKRDPIA